MDRPKRAMTAGGIYVELTPEQAETLRHGCAPVSLSCKVKGAPDAKEGVTMPIDPKKIKRWETAVGVSTIPVYTRLDLLREAVPALLAERSELLALLRTFQEHVVAWSTMEGAPPLPSMLVEALKRAHTVLGP